MSDDFVGRSLMLFSVEKSAQTHHFMACFQFKQVKVFKTLHFGPMHNLSKCRNETHPLTLPQQRSAIIYRNSIVPGFLSLSVNKRHKCYLHVI
jgi:hypothetical protein